MIHARNKYKTKLIFHVDRNRSLLEPAVQINFDDGEKMESNSGLEMLLWPLIRTYTNKTTLSRFIPAEEGTSLSNDRDLILLREERRLLMMLQDITAEIIH